MLAGNGHHAGRRIGIAMHHIKPRELKKLSVVGRVYLDKAYDRFFSLTQFSALKITVSDQRHDSPLVRLNLQNSMKTIDRLGKRLKRPVGSDNRLEHLEEYGTELERFFERVEGF